MTDDRPMSNYCSQTFVVLDKWLNQVSLERGEEALKIVKAAMEKNLLANVTHYESLASSAQENGQPELASKNYAIAKLYKGLLE